MKLNLGCGKAIEPGYINVDILQFKGVDLICDLRYPLPFAGSAFDEIRCFDVLEHLPDLTFVMAEIARVLQNGGLLLIRGPIWGTWNHMVDPTHARGFLPESFDYFDPEKPLGRKYAYSVAFQVEEVLRVGNNLLFRLRRRNRA